MKIRAVLASSWMVTLLMLLPAVAHAAVVLEPLVTVDRPVYITHAGDSRLFIVEQQAEHRALHTLW